MDKIIDVQKAYKNGYDDAVEDIKTIINSVVIKKGCNNADECVDALTSITTITYMNAKEVQDWCSLVQLDRKKQENKKKEEYVAFLVAELFKTI